MVGDGGEDFIGIHYDRSLNEFISGQKKNVCLRYSEKESSRDQAKTNSLPILNFKSASTLLLPSLNGLWIETN